MEKETKLNKYQLKILDGIDEAVEDLMNGEIPIDKWRVLMIELVSTVVVLDEYADN